MPRMLELLFQILLSMQLFSRCTGFIVNFVAILIIRVCCLYFFNLFYYVLVFGSFWGWGVHFVTVSWAWCDPFKVAKFTV